MKLISNRIHVAKVKIEQPGDIIYPDSVTSEHVDGYKLYRVLRVGPGRKTKKGHRVPIECEPGDRLICYSHTNGPIDLYDGTCIITEDQVLAVMKPSSRLIMAISDEENQNGKT